MKLRHGLSPPRALRPPLRRLQHSNQAQSAGTAKSLLIPSEMATVSAQGAATATAKGYADSARPWPRCRPATAKDTQIVRTPSERQGRPTRPTGLVDTIHVLSAARARGGSALQDALALGGNGTAHSQRGCLLSTPLARGVPPPFQIGNLAHATSGPYEPNRTRAA